jgi:hypothetical protein
MIIPEQFYLSNGGRIILAEVADLGVTLLVWRTDNAADLLPAIEAALAQQNARVGGIVISAPPEVFSRIADVSVDDLFAPQPAPPVITVQQVFDALRDAGIITATA